MPIVNWLNGRWTIKQPTFTAVVHKTQNVMDEIDIRPVTDHPDLFSACLSRLE